MIVLLKEAWICAIPSVTVFFTFFFALEVVLAIVLLSLQLLLDWFTWPFASAGVSSGALAAQR